MQTVDIQDAAQHLSEIVMQVQNGETFVLTQSGEAVAQVSPVQKKKLDVSRRIGLLEGQGSIPENWKELGRKEIEEDFYGKE